MNEKELILNDFINNVLSDNLCGYTSCNIRYSMYEYMDC